VNRGVAIDLLDRLHLAQNEFYAGGLLDHVGELIQLS
jgi:hypothetical protein